MAGAETGRYSVPGGFVSLYTETSRAEITKYSPSGKVPVLIDGKIKVRESLAIGEYLAEKFPHKHLWPGDPAARTMARSAATEMHAGFSALRQHMPMNCDSGHPWPSSFGRAARAQFRSWRNCRKHLPGKGRTPEVLKHIARITTLWNDCRARFGKGGGFLLGKFSIADAMYAPVALRFVTYAVELDPVSAAYVQTVAAMPAIQQWVADARAEIEVIPPFEPYA